MENTQISKKSGRIAWVLCIFTGMLGLHRFYVGKIGTGLLMLVTGGGLGIWAIIDLVAISNDRFEDKNKKRVIMKKNESRKQRIIRTVVALIIWLLLFVGSIIAVVYYITQGLVDVVNLQLAALKEGNYQKAYSYTSKEFQTSNSIDQFKILIEKHPLLKNNTSYSFYQRALYNDLGALSGTLTSVDGGKTSIQYFLIKEDGTWKIYDFNILSTTEGKQ